MYFCFSFTHYVKIPIFVQKRSFLTSVEMTRWQRRVENPLFNFLFLFLYFFLLSSCENLEQKKKLVNIYSPAAELSWMPKDISCFLMSSSSATELCLFLPRKIVGVAGGTKNTRKLFVFLWHKEKKEVFGPLAHNNFSLSIRDKDTSNILDFFRD